MLFIKLFYEFFKIGLFSIGGGMATFPFFYELSDKYPKILSKTFLVDMIAISESTPGPIGINLSTFVGFDMAINKTDSIFFSIFISILSTMFLVLPAFVVIFLFMKFFDDFVFVRDFSIFLFFMRIASIVILIKAVYNLLKIYFVSGKSFFDIKILLLTLFFFVLSISNLKLKNFSFFIIFAFLGVLMKL